MTQKFSESEAKDVQDAAQSGDKLMTSVSFSETLIRNTDIKIRHAIIVTSPETHKIVFQVFNIPQQSREKIGKLLFTYCQDHLSKLPGIYAEADHNPIFRKNWDFMVYHVPCLLSKHIHDRFLDFFTSSL